MYRCESWTIKKARCQRIDAFKLWWRRLLRVSWTERSSKKSIQKEINPEYSLQGLMLKFQYSGHWYEEPTHWKRPWCWERLRVGAEGGDRGWDGWMTSSPQWWWAVMRLSKLWNIEKDGEARHGVVHGLTRSWTLLSNWATTVIMDAWKPLDSWVLFYLSWSKQPEMFSYDTGDKLIRNSHWLLRLSYYYS